MVTKISQKSSILKQSYFWDVCDLTNIKRFKTNVNTVHLVYFSWFSKIPHGYLQLKRLANVYRERCFIHISTEYYHIYQLEQSPLLTELTEHNKDFDIYVRNPDPGLRQAQIYPYPPHLITGGLRQAQRYPYPPSHLITGGLRQAQRYPYPPHLITGGLRQTQSILTLPTW